MNFSKLWWSLSALILFFSVTAQEQNNTLLYKITGSKLKKPSYVFGTMHMVCAEDLDLGKNVEKAVKKSKKAIFEIDLTNMEGLQAFIVENSTSKDSLSKGLTAAQKTNLAEQLQVYNIKLDQVEMIKPFIISTMMAAKMLPNCEVKAVDNEILNLAQAHELEVGYLETAKEQLTILDKALNRESFIKYMQSNTNFDEDFKIISTAYHNKNLSKLRQLVYSNEVATQEFIQHLLVNRNNNWMLQLPQLMAKEPCFIAVGAAHLVGPDGLLTLLQNQGYTVTPLVD